MIVLGVILATIAGLLVGRGDPVLTVAPVLLFAFAYALVKLSARTWALGLVLVVLCVESPQDRPAAGLWESPLLPLGKVLYQSLGATFGVGLPVSPFELLVVGVAAALLFRRVRAPGAAGIHGVLLGQAVAIAALVVFGLARGGEFQAAYWQVRQLALMPVFAFIFHEVLTGSRGELRAVGRLVVGAAVFKALWGALFFYGVAVPRGLTPAYVTTHADTVLFVGALLILAFHALQARTRASMWALAGCGAVILWGVYLNERRIAWVALSGGLVALWWVMAPGAAKRRAMKLGLVLVPMIALYAAAGWGSHARIFQPLQALGSVSEGKDSSTLAREIENYNLAMTVRSSPLFGQGFGHPYQVLVSSDATYSFDLYRYIPHNSIYALYMAGGAVGFFFIWLPLTFAVLLAVRAARASKDVLVRTCALGAVASVVLFSLQAWGDMGTQSYPPVLFAALGLGLAARAAMNAGAWPAASAAPKQQPARAQEVYR